MTAVMMGKRKLVRSEKLRRSARGQECTVRVPGVCNYDPQTSVLAHYRMLGSCGVGLKPSDVLGAWSCHACHEAVDFREYVDGLSQVELRLYHAEGVLRTIEKLFEEGVIRVV